MDRKAFYASIKRSLTNDRLTVQQVDGMEAILNAMERKHAPLTHAAYGLATTWHETARTMQPIAEYGKGKGRKYGVPDKTTGKTYYGRGFVQLTWLENYAKAGKLIGADLVNNPELAMRPDIAAIILVDGMRDGWFTGKANKHYLDKTPPDYIGARRIINGTDKATMIADYAAKFEKALRMAGYAVTPVAETEQKPAKPNSVIAKPNSVSVEPGFDAMLPPLKADASSWWSRFISALKGA